MEPNVEISPARGKLGILTPGLGAVATTFIAGVMAVLKGLGQPIGSLTQMGTIRLGKRTEKRVPRIKEFVPLAEMADLVFGGWDIFDDNVYEAASKARVLDAGLLDDIRSELETIKPMPAVFDQYYVKRLDGAHVKKEKTGWICQTSCAKTSGISNRPTISAASRSYGAAAPKFISSPARSI